jgi:hypothetical protein
LAGSLHSAPRSEQAVSIDIPERPCNGQDVGFDITGVGRAIVDGGTVTLRFDEFQIADRMTNTRARLQGQKLGLVFIKHQGDHVVDVSNEVALQYQNLEPDSPVRLGTAQAQFDIDSAVDLRQIWLRLRVYYDKGYYPVDAPKGHLGFALR